MLNIERPTSKCGVAALRQRLVKRVAVDIIYGHFYFRGYRGCANQVAVMFIALKTIWANIGRKSEPDFS